MKEITPSPENTTFSLMQNINEKFKEDVLEWKVDLPNFVYNISPLIILMRQTERYIFGKNKLSIKEFDSDQNSIITTIKGVQVATIRYSENSIFITSKHSYQKHDFFQVILERLVNVLNDAKPTIKEMYLPHNTQSS